MPTFGALADELLAAEFEESPVRASALGLTEYDDRLDDLTATAFERRAAAARAWLGRFEAVPDGELSDDETIDRDLAIATLRGRAILEPWQAWRRDPLSYTDPIVGGLFGLFLQRLRPEPELVDAAIARLAAAPAALDAGRTNLDPGLAHPLIVRRALASARGGLRYVRDLLPGEVADASARARLAESATAVVAALEGWSAFLEDLAERAHGDWRLGPDAYTRLLREREALPYDVGSLRERGRAEFERVAAEMREVSRHATGSDDYAVVLSHANADHPPTEAAMRDTYAAWTERARAFLRDTGLVTLPAGEACDVLPSPVFRRPVLGVASYQSPPPFSDRRLGHFFVPFAPDDAPPEEVEQRLAGNSNGHIPTTAVHEAYPGHHWHHAMRRQNPSRLRQVFGTPYFGEGWALYAERVMRERGFFTDPLQELYHLNATLFRAARIVVDTSLHAFGMTEDEAIRFMTEKVSLPEATARAEVGRYCSWPTQASAYLTGCLEILAIRDDFLGARGHDDPLAAPVGVLREFHDAITFAGSLPLGLARRAVLGGGPAAA